MPEKIIIDNESLQDDKRFSRFELISWWDQDILKNAKILVIGAGALGNEILKNLALLGVGNILVADMDKIECSNLSRSCLYRERDIGRFKAEVAAESAKDIYPELNIECFTGNIVHDLGRGAYHWADLTIGGLDNREARLSINRDSLAAGKPWIDGAIEVLNGIVRMFSPGEGPCYECTMSEIDWKMLEARRSCALLTRDEMLSGRTPTTPTTSSIIAGLEVQEAVKYLHGMETLSGKGLVFNGHTNESYIVNYTRKQDCFSHEEYAKPEKLGCGTGDITVGKLLERARKKLGPEAVIELGRDIISALECMSCGYKKEFFVSLGKVTEKEAVCPECGKMCTPETLSSAGYDNKLDNMTFSELGVPPYDIITARAGFNVQPYIFDGDAKKVLGRLAG